MLQSLLRVLMTQVYQGMFYRIKKKSTKREFLQLQKNDFLWQLLTYMIQCTTDLPIKPINRYNQLFAWNVPKISKIKSKILVYNIWSPQRILTPYNIWSPMKNLNPTDKFDFKMQFQTLYLSVSDRYQIGIGSVSDRYQPIWKKPYC